MSRVIQMWGRGSCAILGIRIRVTGSVPQRPHFIVSNHLSYVDILVLAALTGCRFVAKVEIARWPIFGPMCRVVDTWFVDRQNSRNLLRLLEDMKREGVAGWPVVLFAEGTTGPGHRVLRFRSPLLELPVVLGQPVDWVALSYRVPPESSPAYLSVSWWAEMPLVPHLLSLMKLPWIETKVTFGNESVTGKDRKQLAAQLWEKVSGAFEPMVDSEEIERLERLRREHPESAPPLLRPRGQAGQLI